MLNSTCFNNAHLLNFVLCLTGAAILFRITDIELARCVVEAVPTYAKHEPSQSLGQAAKFFLSTALVYCLVQANCPPLGTLLSHAWTLCEQAVSGCCSFVLQTIWHACG